MEAAALVLGEGETFNPCIEISLCETEQGGAHKDVDINPALEVRKQNILKELL